MHCAPSAGPDNAPVPSNDCFWAMKYTNESLLKFFFFATLYPSPASLGMQAEYEHKESDMAIEAGSGLTDCA